MATKKMYFSRTSSGYNAEDGDVIDYNPTESLSFGSSYICTYFEFYVDGGLTSATTSARYHGAILQVKSNGNWYSIWSGDLYLPAKGTTGESISFQGDISSSYRSIFGTYGITDIRLKQQENENGYSYALRGTTGSGTLTITYEENITAITPPPTVTASASSIAPGGTVTIEWSGAEHGINNNITGYKLQGVYNNGSTDVWVEFDEISSSSLRGSATLTLPNSGTYTIFVYARNSADGEFSVSNTGYATVRTEVTNPGKPTNFKINGNTSTVYIGNTGSPAISFTWTAPTDTGINNSIASYTIYKDSVAVKTGITTTSLSNLYTTSTDASSKVGTYYVKVLGTVQGSANSSNVQVALISSPTTPTITSTIPSSTTSDISLKWSIGTAPKGSTVTYTVAYTPSGGTKTTLKTGLTTNTYTFPISTVNANTDFTITITAVATASGGGTVSSTYTTSTITRVSSISFSNAWINVTNENNTANFPSYAYNKVILSWNAATSPDSTSFTYTIKYNLNGGTWSTLTTTSNTSYTINTLSSIASEGKRIGFYIIASDNYGQTAESDYKYITRMSKPIISKASVTDISYIGFTYNFTYSFSVDNENLICTYALGYNGIYNNEIIASKTLTTANGIVNESLSNLNTYLTSGKNLSTSTMLGALYQKVIINKTPKPLGSLTIKLASASIPDCYSETTINFNYNFITAAKNFSEGDFLVGTSTKRFYNEGDIISLYFNPISWKDATGSTLGANIIYTITGNNKTFNNEEIAPKTVINDTAPSTSEDIELPYTLQAQIVYADGTIGSTKTIGGKVFVARWTANDIIYLSSVSKTGNVISGHLILPSLLCGSSQYGNVTGVNYSLYYVGETEAIENYNNIPVNDIDLIDKDISFNFINTSEESVSLYATATFINNSGNTITKTSTNYLLRAAGVPLAIRKGRIGINVDSSGFIVDNDNTRLNSALYIAASSDTAPILELSAGSNATNPVFINFLKGNTLFSNIYYNETQSLFHCDKWYYPVTSVNGQTGDITLSASDIKARPSTWMPTAGDGISISGETISNSGIRTLTATTGDSNGQIKLTINGTSTNVSVKGFSTNYLPLSGGTITKSTSIADNNYAGINFKVTQTDNNVSASAYIRAYDDHDSNGYGVNFVIGATGNMILGGGESATSCYTTDLKDSTGENLYLTSDGAIYFYPNCNTYANHKTSYIDKTGQFYSEGIRGNAIRYSTTQPTTNLAIGQIWLKPKN